MTTRERGEERTVWKVGAGQRQNKSSSPLAIGVVAAAMMLGAGTSWADRKVVDRNNPGWYGAGDHIRITVREAVDPTLEAAHKIRVILHSEKEQNRDLYETLNHPGVHIAHVEKVGQNFTVDLDEPDHALLYLQPKYQGIADTGWFTIDVFGASSWQVPDVRWGQTVVFEWLLPDFNLDDNGNAKPPQKPNDIGRGHH